MNFSRFALANGSSAGRRTSSASPERLHGEAKFGRSKPVGRQRRLFRCAGFPPPASHEQADDRIHIDSEAKDVGL